jgi:hypothetical protein
MIKYAEFINEKVLYDLIIESKIVYSSKFINILHKMKDNKLAKKLLDIYSKDFDVVQNYIDISDEKDSVMFSPDKRIKDMMKDKQVTWKVINSSRYLTHSDLNNRIFERLGYDKTKQENWAPQIGTIGIIINETVSKVSGNIYVLFVGLDNDKRFAVLNKEALVMTEESEDPRVWTTYRNKIKIGRLVRAILVAANVKFVDKDIEDFVNQYKATYDFINDALSRFDLVNGDKIAYWYNKKNYEKNEGTLGKSCMADVDSYYFDIYTKNPQVKLAILYDDNGTKTDGGKYKSDKIKGRALVWDAKIDGSSVKFMDRIYTINDSDVELFKQYAEKNGIWYKIRQDSDNECVITNGSEKKTPIIIVDLNHGEFDAYPYLDTLCYLNSEDGKLSNDIDAINANRQLNDTSGGYDEVG